MSSLESALRDLAASLDDETLEALASRGLLRRARKDMESGEVPRVVDETDAGLLVRVGSYDVTMPAVGPAAARCSCPAANICHHILGAVLALREGGVAHSSPSDPTASTRADDELLAISLEHLEEWAGRESFNAGMTFASTAAVEIRRDPHLRMIFPVHNAAVRVVMGAGLDGMIVSGGRTDPRRLVVAAMLAHRRAAGAKVPSVPANALLASEGTPRSRAEVLDGCERLLEETLSSGLSRLSHANYQRWTTLAVSALGVNLPRLASVLRAIGDDVSLSLARDARADAARTFARMTDAYALCAALRAGGDGGRADLVGEHRTRYDEVGNLDLLGVAAWPWITASGHSGITILFWDRGSRRWTSWSESRPTHQTAGFAAGARYDGPSPWDGADSPRQLARGAFRLLGARRNARYRLSASRGSRVLLIGRAVAHVDGPAPITNWTALGDRAARAMAVGLHEPDPLDAIVAVRPSAWGDRRYDAVRQRLLWTVVDDTGHEVALALPFDTLTESAIKYLEGLEPHVVDGASVIARVDVVAGELTLLPYAIHFGDGRVDHLMLDHLATASVAAVAGGPVGEPSFVVDEDTYRIGGSAGAIGALLAEIDEAVLAAAEFGVGPTGTARRERAAPLAARAEQLGLDTLTTVIRHFVASPTPRRAFQCAYVVALHRQGACAERS